MRASDRVKTIGIVGGIAPASTIEYYKYLIDAYRQKSPGGEYPSIVINSIDPRRMLGMMDAGNLPGTVEYLVSALRVLADAGVNLALFASNTPHVLFDEIRRQSPVSLISIVDAARDEALRRGLRRVGLLGTRFTMQRHVLPRRIRQRWYRARLAGSRGHRPRSRQVHGRARAWRLPRRHARRNTRRHRPDAHARTASTEWCSAEPSFRCCSLPDSHPELGILDTMRAHVDAAVARMLA